MTPRRAAALAGVLGIVTVVAAVVALTSGPGRVGRLAGSHRAGLTDPADAPIAADFVGVGEWINSEPLSLRRDLRGQVVMVDFWTYSCINCRRTFPLLRRLHQTYASRGLTIVGVHAPEFDFEKVPANVRRAVRELDVTWAVATDPDFATWRAYDNQYWPQNYLVDRNGRIRFMHIGEGGDAEIEAAVRALLDEGGDAGPMTSASTAPEQPAGLVQTPEVYLGARRGERYLAGGVVPPGRTVVRRDEGDDSDQAYLSGRFTGAAEWLGFDRDARLDLRYTARDVYAVVAPPAGRSAAEFEVLLDGEPVPVDRRGRDVVATMEGRTVVRVTNDDLRHLVTGDASLAGHLTLVARSPGVRLFTFTFGS